MGELGDWDAVETAARLRRGEVSARDVVEAAIRRAEAARALGGLVTETFERALERADAPVDRQAPFFGVPWALKDLSNQAGVPTRWGSRGASGRPAPASDATIARFERLGFVSLGKSATPELGLTATTEPLGFPPCRNPWDPSRTPGGSSGGSAVLVSAGVVPLAHAGDGGGSIRIPAACCGLVGLKPTRGRLDIEGSPLLPINLAAHGVVSRTVRDTIAFFTAVEATTPSERPPITPVPPAPPAPLRIGLSTTSPAGTPVDDAQRRAVEQAGRLCESLGHHVEPIASPIDEAFPRDFFHFWSLLAVIQTRTIHLVARGRFDTSQWDPWTLHMAGRFRETSREVLAATLRLRAFGARFRRVFSRFDVVVMPTTAHAPPPLGHLAPTVPFETARARLRQFVPFTSAFNASGCPALSLPLGRDALGLPVGVQLGADLDGERSLLSLALTLEAAAPWPRRAPLPEAVSGAPVG